MTIEEKALKVAKKVAKEAGKKIAPLFGKVTAIKEKKVLPISVARLIY